MEQTLQCLKKDILALQGREKEGLEEEKRNVLKELQEEVYLFSCLHIRY